MSDLPKIGDRFMVCATAYKDHDWKWVDGLDDDNQPARWRIATGTKWSRRAFWQPQPAVFIGWRTVYEGSIEYSYEEENIFRVKSSRKVYIFVKNERTQSYFAFPEDIEAVRV